MAGERATLRVCRRAAGRTSRHRQRAHSRAWRAGGRAAAGMEGAAVSCGAGTASRSLPSSARGGGGGIRSSSSCSRQGGGGKATQVDSVCSGDLDWLRRAQAHAHSCLAFVPVAEARSYQKRARWRLVAGQVPATEKTTPRRALLPNTCPLQLQCLSHILSSTGGYVALFLYRENILLD